MIKQQFSSYEDKKTRIKVEGGVIKFGVVSDTHLGSNYCQITFLQWFYKHIAKKGARFVLHAGDVTDGIGIYRSQEFEVHKHGFSEQLEYVCEKYPSDIPTYYITGN